YDVGAEYRRNMEPGQIKSSRSRLHAADRVRTRAHDQRAVASLQSATHVGFQEFAAVSLHAFEHRSQRVAGLGAVPVLIETVEAALHGDLAGPHLMQPGLAP